MDDRKDLKQKRMQIARLLFIAMTLGIVVLSAQFLISGWMPYQYYALALGVFCLFMISFIIAGIIKSEDQ